MNFSLTTDKEYQLAKQEIEDDVDTLIDSAKSNLTIKIKKEIDDASILDSVLELVYADLEKKRTNIKKHFISQLETITKEAYKKALFSMVQNI